MTDSRHQIAVVGMARGQQKRSALKPLTGLRLVAAVLVVITHFLFLPLPASHGPLRLAVWMARHVAECGFLGVSFFFILSGFILTYNYVDGVGKLTVSLRSFWVARWARIYPVYLVGFLLAALPYTLGQWCTGTDVYPVCTRTSPLATALAELSLTQTWTSAAGYPFNPPGWSLAVEAFFYLCFPLLAPTIARLSTRRSLGAVLLLAWVVLIPPAAVDLLVATSHLGHVRDALSAHTAIREFLLVNPLCRLPEFVMGIVLGRLYALRGAGERRAGSRLLATPAVFSLGAALVILGVLSLGRLPSDAAQGVLVDPLFALLIYSLAFGEGPLALALSLPPIVLLGEASYSLYILHYPLWDWLNRSLAAAHVAYDPHAPAFFVGYLCAVLGASVLSLRLIEQPARRALRRTLGGGTPAAHAIPARPLARHLGAAVAVPEALDAPPGLPPTPRVSLD